MQIQKIYRLALVCLSIELITGCGSSYFTSRETNPVVIDDTNNANFWGNTLKSTSFTTFSTTASRRMVVVLQNEGKTEICAEPSPDVGEAFASAVADGIRVAVPVEGAATTEVSNQYAKAVATQIASLLYRSQGLQLYRDAMHNLCVDRLNNWTAGTASQTPVASVSISGDSQKNYEDYRQYFFDKAVELVKFEAAAKTIGIPSAAAGNKDDIKSVVEAIEKLLKATKQEK